MKNIITLLIIINSLTLSSQSYDSKFEKELISKDTITEYYFESLLVIDSTVTIEIAKSYKQNVDNLINSFPDKEIKDRKEKKRINRIYNEIHDKFLKKFTIESYYSDIFKTGTYNCVTATALYAYVFDKLDVPCIVKELPTHVFLIVYPNSLNIYLETTVPGEYAYIMPSESKIKDVVDELISYKLATENEVQEKGYQKFYEDYFYNKKSIEKNSLIGVQYYNKGIQHIQDGNNQKAFNSFIKAKKLYQSPLMDLFMKAYTIDKIYDLDYTTSSDITYFIETLENEKYSKEINNNLLESVLLEITRNNNNSFISNSIVLFENIKNIEKRNISLEYLNEYLAREEASEENHTSAILYADKTLKINPENKKAKQIIEYFTFRKLGLSTFQLDDLKTFTNACEKHPFIKENKKYAMALSNLYLNISFQNYRNERINTAEKYRNKFEAIVKNPELLETISKIEISQLYQVAGNHYYYKDQYKKSYHIYTKGLSFVPNNPELQKKAKWSKEEL